MKIEWNRVTWYSKLIAIILFVATAALFFILGLKYGHAFNSQTSEQTPIVNFVKLHEICEYNEAAYAQQYQQQIAQCKKESGCIMVPPYTGDFLSTCEQAVLLDLQGGTYQGYMPN